MKVAPFFWQRIPLAAILLVSLALRIWLALLGGEGWWADERRFEVSLLAAHKLAIGHVAGALRTLLGSADHLGFKALGVPVALGVNAGLPIAWAAIFFGAFSVGSIFLVWKIALESSRDEDTALWSAFFAAASVSLFYYSRHLFPYDPALFLGLCAALAGLKGRPFVAGLAASCGFVTYNGYWLFCGAAVAIGLLAEPGGLRRTGARFAWAAAGLALPVLALILVARALGLDLVRSYLEFSTTVNLGDFSLGWTFPWEYLWKAEGLLLAVWFAVLALALAGAVRGQWRYLWIWSGAVLVNFIGMAVASAVLHKFVIYGRTARSLDPLFALVCGGCAAELCRRVRRPGWMRMGMAAGILAIAVPHFARVLGQWYPDRFRAKAEAIEATLPHDRRLRIVNAFYFNDPRYAVSLPAEAVLFERPHPDSYEPFLYEGFTRAEREDLRARDATMKLIRMRNPPPVGGLPGGYLGPLRMVLRLADTDLLEPLITTGVRGRADCLYLQRLPSGKFRVALDHWGGSGRSWPEVRLDPNSDHVLEASLGSLLPPSNSPLRTRLWVRIDGRIVLNQPAEFYPATPDQVDLGLNLLGASECPAYNGRIESVVPIPPEKL